MAGVVRLQREPVTQRCDSHQLPDTALRGHGWQWNLKGPQDDIVTGAADRAGAQAGVLRSAKLPQQKLPPVFRSCPGGPGSLSAQ